MSHSNNTSKINIQQRSLGQDTIYEVREKDRAKQKVLEFIREVREYNKDDDPKKIQADIDEAVRAVKNAELAKFQLQPS